MNYSLRAIGMAAGLAISVSAVALVTTGCAGDRYSRSTGTYIDDTALSAKVKTQLLTAKDVKGTEVSVRTYDGVVQLSGFIDTLDEKYRALSLAQSIPGVKSVRDDLIVKAPEAAQGPAPVIEAAGAQPPIDDTTTNR